MQRRTVIGVGMLIAGCLMVLAAFIALGTRVTATAVLVRDTALDLGTTYFLGTSGDPLGALALTVGLIVLGVAGIVLAGLGYRRVAAPGPSPAAIQYPVHPAAHLRQIQIGR